MRIRRVVAGANPQGRAAVLSDGVAPRIVELRSLPGFSAALLWSTDSPPAVGQGVPVDRSETASFVPAAGETRLMMVTFPPDAVMTRPEFDAAAFGQEFAASVPGLAETFEPEHPGMHTTDSIDYDVVLDGEITLELDDGVEVVLRQQDVAVQHGNRHAWRNKSDRPATMLFVLVGAARR